LMRGHMSSFAAASAAAPLLHPLYLHRHLRRRSPPTHQRINCVPLAAILCEWPGSWGALGCVRGGSCGFQSTAASSTSTWHRTVDRTRRESRPRRPALRSRKKGEEGWLACHPCPFRHVRAAVGRSRAWLTELSLSESTSLGYVGLQAYSLLQSCRAAWSHIGERGNNDAIRSVHN